MTKVNEKKTNLLPSFSEGNSEHIPVLLNEVMTSLALHNHGVYVDATFGRGGHSRAILSSGVDYLFAFDRDPSAQAHAEQWFSADENFSLIAKPFSQLESELTERNINQVDGLMADLGVSSPQFDVAERGFSFRLDGPLDMRMDNRSGQPVSEWLAYAEHSEIARVLRVYGDESDALKIASAIIAKRQHEALTSTSQLASIVADVKSKQLKRKNNKQHRAKKTIHPATKTFQALRIFINKELEELEKFLEQSLRLLKVGGRLCVISFHSLEDRIVKNFMRDYSRVDPTLAGIPNIPDDLQPPLRIIGKAIKASDEEIALNTRSRSAVLRVAEKIVG